MSYLSVSVDVDVNEIVDNASKNECEKILQRMVENGSIGSIPRGVGDGDSTTESIVERAYLAAKRMEHLPTEIADLFYLVHGRALS